MAYAVAMRILELYPDDAAEDLDPEDVFALLNHDVDMIELR